MKLTSLLLIIAQLDSSLSSQIDTVMNNSIFSYSYNNIRIITLIELLAITICTLLLLYSIHNLIYRSNRLANGKKYSINNLARYIIITIAVLWGLNTVGLNIKMLLAGSAALLVGVGLGLQNLFSDFISGIILLIDNSIKVGDIIDVNGLVCQVQDINLRTTLVLTRDDKYILLPNTKLTKNQVINWTHTSETSRFQIDIGVSYDSDIPTVMRIMKEVVEIESGVEKKPNPFVRFNDYGDSALNFSVYFWCPSVFRVENIKSNIRVKLFAAFNEAGIHIPFPQRVIHLKKEASSKN